MHKNINIVGEIYNLNERYVYVENKENGIRARISRNYLPQISNDKFLNDFENLPSINFSYVEDKVTENGIYIGYINDLKFENKLRDNWVLKHKLNELCKLLILEVDDAGFKFQIDENIYEQKFNDYFCSLKIYIYYCFESYINEVDLKYVNWDSRLNSPHFEYPYSLNPILEGEIICAKLIYVRSQNIKKHSRIDDIFYLIDASNFIYRVKFGNFYNYTKYLKLGDEINIITKEFNKYENITSADFQTNYSQIIPLKDYQVGTELIAKVVSPLPGGVICVTEDDEVIFIGKQDISIDEKFKVLNVLSPGDELLVSFNYVKSNSSEEDKFIRKFSFIKLEKRIFESRNLNNIVDMKATYKRGVAGGFGREIDFRKNVLDFFNHTCVLCDEYLKYEIYSSAEAAHIVPRASRGVNKVDNSFCLCKEHHWSFDKGFWSVSDSGDIILSNRLSKNENFILKYRKFEGKKIRYDILSKINIDALTWHRENIFK